MSLPNPHPDLASFLTALERAGQLARITAEVDPYLEVSEITQRVTRMNGPALRTAVQVATSPASEPLVT